MKTIIKYLEVAAWRASHVINLRLLVALLVLGFAQALVLGVVLSQLGCSAVQGSDTDPGDIQAVEWRSPTTPVPIGPVIDCQGSVIGPLKVTEPGTTVRNCETSAIRVMGPAKNGEAEILRARSARDGYVDWIRAAAPSHVRIEDTTIVGTGTIPLYLAPGVTFASIDRVEISGESTATAIYLGAETHGNVFRHVRIDARKMAREAVAIDASSHNLFQDVVIVMGNHPAFRLYRNCGSGGVSRHTTPSWNEFHRVRLQPQERGQTGLHFSSRDGLRFYCVRDNDHPYGSGVSDLDWARWNHWWDGDFGGTRVKYGDSAAGNRIDK